MAEAPAPQRPKTSIPRNPGRTELGMQAKLLFPTKEIVEQFYVPLVYTACRTCYSELDPQEIFRKATAGEINPASMQRLISNVIESGHGSTIEHVVFTFALSGVSRTLSHQLVRHRAGVAFDQQSQRYVKFKGAATMLPATIAEGDPALRERYESQIDGSLALYGELLEAGVPGEDARFVFPNATRTNLVMTTNLRALIHMSGLRLCTMAQWEIRRLFQLIRHEIFQVSPFLGSFLAPEVRAARLLRRVQQPRRALPDPPAQGHGPRRVGAEAGGGPGRADETCRSMSAGAGSSPASTGDDDPPRVQPHRPGRGDWPAPARRGDRRLPRRRRARVRARRGDGAAAVVRSGDVLYEAPSELHRVRNEGSADALALLAAVSRRRGRAAPGRDAPPVARRWRARPPAGRREGRRARRDPAPAPRPARDFGSVTFTVTEVELDPGASDAWHVHPGAEHALVVFEGRGSIQVGEVEETLEPLKGIRILPGRPHRVRNDSRLLLRYFVCASPGTDPTIDRAPAEAPPRRLDA